MMVLLRLSWNGRINAGFRLMKRKLRGMMPIISRAVLSIIMRRPMTEGSAPNLRCQ